MAGHGETRMLNGGKAIVYVAGGHIGGVVARPRGGETHGIPEQNYCQTETVWSDSLWGGC
jgi:poly(3-hydroxyalkanoate) synthetase